MFQAKHIIFIFITQFFDFGESHISIRDISNIYNFVMQLRNSSDDVHGYIGMIQAIFCPEQPICTNGDGHQIRDILKALPATLTVENMSIHLDDIKSFLGICCLSCSCSENCKENDNCCLSKFYSNHTSNNETVKSECIAANVRSYNRRTGLDTNYARYFMTTKCFEDRTNSSLLSKCETPDMYSIEDTVPVTSMKTGRTYWNRHCAACNGVTEDLKQWNSKLEFRKDPFVYFNANKFVIFEEHSLEELHFQFASSSNIIYIPPVSMEHNRCFEKQLATTCKQNTDAQIQTESSFFRQACEQFYNPVYFVSVLRKHIYRNIFCFLCLEYDMPEPTGNECSLDKAESGRNTQIEITAILDYRATSKVNVFETHYPSFLEENPMTCPCDQVYDYHKMKCRPLLCPVGEIRLGCQCIQLIKNLSGMPVYLKLKVMPLTEHQFTPVDLQVRNFHTKLKKLLKTIVRNILVDILATFRLETDVSPNYLCIAVVRTKTGYDTKETLENFMPFLDSTKSLEFSSIETTFLVHLLTRVGLWYELETHGDKLELKAKRLDKAEENLTTIYSNSESIRTYYFCKKVQEFSSLLYCKQVELGKGEFIEEHGKVLLKSTSKPKYVWDFYKISSSEIRICADEYFDQSEVSLSTMIFSSNMTTAICLVSLCMLF